MHRELLEEPVNIPDLEDFERRFPQYGPFARNQGNFMFNIVMNPLSFFRAKVATEMGLPAVSGIANICLEATPNGLNDYLKQFIGALVCILMENNDYSKTGTKKAIPHPAFTKGEFYQPH